MLVAKEREREKVTQNDREWLLHCWEKTFQKHSKKDFVHFQCDQIWRNCATLVKFSVFGQCLEDLLNILNLFWHFLSNWALFDCCIWQNFDKFVKQSGHAVPIYSIFIPSLENGKTISKIVIIGRKWLQSVQKNHKIG